MYDISNNLDCIIGLFEKKTPGATSGERLSRQANCLTVVYDVLSL